MEFLFASEIGRRTLVLGTKVKINEICEFCNKESAFVRLKVLSKCSLLDF